jgi:hypothetical protein
LPTPDEARQGKRDERQRGGSRNSALSYGGTIAQCVPAMLQFEERGAGAASPRRHPLSLPDGRAARRWTLTDCRAARRWTPTDCLRHADASRPPPDRAARGSGDPRAAAVGVGDPPATGLPQIPRRAVRRNLAPTGCRGDCTGGNLGSSVSHGARRRAGARDCGRRCDSWHSRHSPASRHPRTSWST